MFPETAGAPTCRHCGLGRPNHGVRNSRKLVKPGTKAAAYHRFELQRLVDKEVRDGR